MIDWAKVIIGIINLLVTITSTFEKKMLIDAGQKQAIANQLQRQAYALQKAKAARETVRSEHVRDPSSVMREDQFTRADDP